MKTRRTDPWVPLGRALADVHAGAHPATLTVESTLWEDEEVSAAEYFRPDSAPLPSLECRALARCRGRVLDVGAGAGRHALELQRAGFEVVALDIAEEAVEVMRGRGVRDPRLGNLWTLENERFDTLLMLMHGLGLVGTLAGLGDLLLRLPDLLEPGGQLLADSADLSMTVADSDQPAGRGGTGRYLGEVEFRLRYRDWVGARYPWLFVDPGTLALLAESAGLQCEILARGDRGTYLACVRVP